MKYSLIVLAAAAAVDAVPFPQGVTQSIAPSAAAPAGCAPTYAGTFGIAVMPVTAGGSAAPASTGGAYPVSQIPDGQVQGSKSTMAAVNQIGDGQIQQQKPTAAPVNQISDGQIQQQKPTATPVNQISDGQVQQQKPTATPVNQISDGQVQQQKPTATPVNQISDGQVQQQKPTATPVNQISDGQVQQQQPTATPVKQISDGQVQQPPATPVGQASDGQPQASGTAGAGSASYVACKADDTLEITLANGILTDNQGRIGYIASNYQFQFDGPPQAGAIYTAGFSVCGNGSLALGGSSTFYRCLSGDFYNLYDRSWAAQCEPINIDVVDLVDC